MPDELNLKALRKRYKRQLKEAFFDPEKAAHNPNREFILKQIERVGASRCCKGTGVIYIHRWDRTHCELKQVTCPECSRLRADLLELQKAVLPTS
jgi:hypothetical protein